LNSRTIARNAVWYGLENGVGFVLSMVTSIAIARTLGPIKMGYVIYVSWLAQMLSSLGGIGVPAATCKYMAEFLGAGDAGTSRFIYSRTLLLQAVLASLATAGGIVWVLHGAPVGYRTAAFLLMLSVWPAMVNFISAQANVASERLSANLPASIVAVAVFFVFTTLTIAFHWGVNGIAFGMLAMRTADLIVRLVPTARRIFLWEPNQEEPIGLGSRMLSFASQSVAAMILTLIVWDRSEVLLLKHLTTDIRQVAFYSVAFSLAERLLIIPSVFGSATGASIYAQYGRDKSRLPAMASAAFRYLALISIPIHAVAAALAGSALLLLYGAQYRGAILVVALAPLFCLPKAFLAPIQNLFESNEQQRYFIAATIAAAFVDIGVAWYTIPTLGAVGACLGSGAAQITAVSGMWAIGIYRYKIKLPLKQVSKVIAISAVAAGCAHFATVRLSPLESLIIGGAVALAVLVILGYLLRVLELEDCRRFTVLAELLPAALRRPCVLVLNAMSRRLKAEPETALQPDVSDVEVPY
jgi:O-antigen/teichoic acid export membrane protein